MPELPDLTVFVDNLSKAVTGKDIVSVAFKPSKKSNVTQEELSRSLITAKIEKVRRVGKEVCFHFSNGVKMWVHLMLNGGFVLTTAKEFEGLDYLILGLTFQDGSALAVTDPKAWANVTVTAKEEAAVRDGLEVSADYLRSVFQKKPRMLAKAFLIDQGLVGGIGNAYADEILWRARISPKSRVGKLPAEAIEALAEAIPSVLKEAIEEIRKRRPDAVAGEVRDFLKVHGPGRKTSPTGGRIKKEQIASKTTYYTDEQTLYE